jgi:hypothetical protein
MVQVSRRAALAGMPWKEHIKRDGEGWAPHIEAVAHMASNAIDLLFRRGSKKH